MKAPWEIHDLNEAGRLMLSVSLAVSAHPRLLLSLESELQRPEHNGSHPSSVMTTRPPRAGDVTFFCLCFLTFKCQEQPFLQGTMCIQDSPFLSSEA